MALEGGRERKESSKHNRWTWHAMNVLKAAGIGLGVIAFGPAILAAASVALPLYMGYIGVGAGAMYLGNRYDDSQRGQRKS